MVLVVYLPCGIYVFGDALHPLALLRCGPLAFWSLFYCFEEVCLLDGRMIFGEAYGSTVSGDALHPLALLRNLL